MRSPGSCSRSFIYEAVDEVAGAQPHGRPLREHLAALVGNAVVTARWTGVRGHDATGEQVRCRECAKHRINGALLEDRHTLVGAGQPFGNFVAIEVLGRLVEDREQHQPNQASVQVLLEFFIAAMLHKLILYTYE